jgi:hypothetical protein
VTKIIDPTKMGDKLEPQPPFPPEDLVVVCASPAYGYIGVGDFHGGQLVRLHYGLALMPVQVRSQLAATGGSPTQDTALMPIIGGKAGPVEYLNTPAELPYYRVANMHPSDRDTIYGAYMDMTHDVWPDPSDA